jgi:hypothetical protein
MDRPYPTRCDCVPDNHALGAAHGWVQCNSCGLIQHEPSVSDSARYPLPAELRQKLRENWHMRQPGGGITSEHLIVVAHLEEGLQVIYHANRRQEIERQLERGASLVEIWQMAAEGGSTLVEMHRPPWLLKISDTRRRRPSALALARA